MRLYVHDMLFRESMKLHGTQEQQEEWADDIERMKCIGCFAMVREMAF
jgi:alkylation response protein AidB-like acyl-CoA dehydrogenase